MSGGQWTPATTESLLPRIPLPTQDSMTTTQRHVYDAIARGPRGGVRGPFLAALHNPELADKWQHLGEFLRYRTSLAPRLSELAILLTARHWNCQYEWYAHEPHALDAGLAPATIEAIRRGTPPDLGSSDEQVVYGFAREVHESRTVSAATHRRATETLGVLGVVELTALLGYYTMVAMTLNVHDILPPHDAMPLPPLDVSAE